MRFKLSAKALVPIVKQLSILKTASKTESTCLLRPLT